MMEEVINTDHQQVTALIILTLVGLIIAVIALFLRISFNLIKLSTLVNGLIDRISKVEASSIEFSNSSKQTHQRIHDRVDKLDDATGDHEKRLIKLEHLTRSPEKKESS